MDYILAAVRGDRQSDARSGVVPAEIDGVIRKRHGRATLELKKDPIAEESQQRRRSSYLATDTSDMRTKAMEFKKHREESGQLYGWIQAYMVKYHQEIESVGMPEAERKKLRARINKAARPTQKYMTVRAATSAPSCSKVKLGKERRRFGAPGRTCWSPVLMHELYEWFIDLIGMLRCRVSSSILLFQARIICSDILASVQDDINEGRLPAGTTAKLPQLTGDAGMQFIRRWRSYFDVSWRKCSLRFKCAYATILLRVTMVWENILRIRFLHYYLAGRRQ